ncbi:MAG: hypothetical protein LAT54_00935 [Cryomorphaceae bacterium]|nr:hypothetical protein [Cryomorphaceae bacterium]
MRIVAHVISYVIHPSLMPFLGILALLQTYHYTFPEALYYRIIILVVSGTYLLPLLATTIIYKIGYISSIKMVKSEDRKTPFLLTAIFFYFTAQILKSVEAIPLLYIYLMAASVTVFIQLTALGKYKISAHTAGIAGLMTLLTIMHLQGGNLSIHWLGGGYLIMGLVGWSRLFLQAHTQTEVFLGYLSGMVPLVIFVFIF